MTGKKTNKGKVTRQITVVDEDGTVKSELRETYVEKEPDYVKLYLQDIALLNDIPKWVGGVLYELLKRLEWGTNEIILNASVKRRIATDLGIAAKSVDNALVAFVKKNILSRVDTGIYRANPYLFGRGSWEDIKRIRLSIVYDESGKHVEADFVEFPDVELGLNGPPDEIKTRKGKSLVLQLLS